MQMQICSFLRDFSFDNNYIRLAGRQTGRCLSSFYLIYLFIYLFLTMQKEPPEMFCKKKVFLKISQYSEENTCVGVSFK